MRGLPFAQMAQDVLVKIQRDGGGRNVHAAPSQVDDADWCPRRPTRQPRGERPAQRRIAGIVFCLFTVPF